MPLADVLRWGVALCGTLPFVIAAWRLRRAGWWVAAVLAGGIGWTADPLAAALRRVDGALMLSFCGG